MKRQIALALALLAAAAVTLPGCKNTPSLAPPEDAYQSYQGALAKTQELTKTEYSLSSAYTINFTNDGGDKEYTVNQTGSKITVKTGASEDFLWKDKTTWPAEAAASNVEYSLCYLNGTGYYEGPEPCKNRKEITLAEANLIVYGNYEFCDFPESAVKDSSVETAGEDKTFNFTLSTENIETYLNQAYGWIRGAATSGSGTASYRYGDVVMSYKTNKQGLITEQTLKTSLTFADPSGNAGTNAGVQIESTLSLANSGDTVSIAPPNPDEYQLIDNAGQINEPYDQTGLGLGSWNPAKDPDYKLFDLNQYGVNATIYVPVGANCNKNDNGPYFSLVFMEPAGPANNPTSMMRTPLRINNGPEEGTLLDTTAESYLTRLKNAGVNDETVQSIEKIILSGYPAIKIISTDGSTAYNRYAVNHKGFVYWFISTGTGEGYRGDKIVGSLKFND